MYTEMQDRDLVFVKPCAPRSNASVKLNIYRYEFAASGDAPRNAGLELHLFYTHIDVAHAFGTKRLTGCEDGKAGGLMLTVLATNLFPRLGTATLIKPSWLCVVPYEALCRD
jgi:hypothetical protein